MNDELKHATEIVKDPSSYSMSTYVWVMALSIWGGVVRVILDMKNSEKTLRQILAFLAAQSVVSGFTGVMAFFFCESASIAFPKAAFIIGVSSFMGGQSIAVFQLIYRATLKGPPNGTDH